MGEDNGSKPPKSREEDIRDAVARLATILMNEYVPPERYCVVVMVQSGPSARVAHHSANVSGSLDEVTTNYALVGAAAMHAGRMAVLETVPQQQMELMVARFFAECQKHLAHMQAVEQARQRAEQEKKKPGKGRQST